VSALAPCVRGEAWIECRTDAAPGGFGVCPADTSAWTARYQGVYDRWRTLNGELSLDMVSFAPAAMTGSQAAGVQEGAQDLTNALTVAAPPLDFTVGVYLAAFNVQTYAGTRIVDFMHDYAKQPGYALSGTDIAATSLWLDHDGVLDGPDTMSFLKTLAADGTVESGRSFISRTCCTIRERSIEGPRWARLAMTRGRLRWVGRGGPDTLGRIDVACRWGNGPMVA
jgi:hypothetical protein